MDILSVRFSQEERPSFYFIIINGVFSMQWSLEEEEKDIERCMKQLELYPQTGAYKNIF